MMSQKRVCIGNFAWNESSLNCRTAARWFTVRAVDELLPSAVSTAGASAAQGSGPYHLLDGTRHKGLDQGESLFPLAAANFHHVNHKALVIRQNISWYACGAICFRKTRYMNLPLRLPR